MKLRIEHKSIRFRLSEHDIRLLKDGSFLQEKLILGPGRDILFGILIEDSDKIHLNDTPGKIQVVVPTETAKLWLESGRVGLKAAIDNGDDGLAVLLEKDLGPRKKGHSKQE
jgi:hypothetical protein